MKLGESLRKGMYLLGSLLVGRGVTSEHHVEEALGEQERRKRQGAPHKRLGQLLIEMSALSHDDLDRVLEEQRQVRREDLPSEATTRAPAGQAAEAVTATPEAIEAEVTGEGEAREAAPAAPAERADEPEPAFVASEKGVVYHTPDCLAAKKISPSNRMTFATPEQAEAAGKRACSKCC